MLDPNEYPHRPNHPDFWRLANLVLQADGRAEEDPARAEKMVADIVDPDTLSYMALQRAMRLVGAETREQVDANKHEVMRLAAIYFDAFILGARFEASKKKKKGGAGR